MNSHLGLPQAYLATGSSSFADFLADLAPDVLPGRMTMSSADANALAPHGTTIVSLRGDFGAVMAGDRRATMGNVIAQRDIEKVFVADEHSMIGIAGTAGIAIELVRLFQVELEHYEKIEGLSLSLDGKANRLSVIWGLPCKVWPWCHCLRGMTSAVVAAAYFPMTSLVAVMKSMISTLLGQALSLRVDL